MMVKLKDKIQYGDFQTPINLARDVCNLLKDFGISPRSVLEPTCGKGSFILASLEMFSEVSRILGVDINPEYVKRTKQLLSKRNSSEVELINADFFDFDFKQAIEALAEPFLIIGNPPWVTNSELGSIGSLNLPKKKNFQNHRGIEALTGKSNFDISEWILIHLIDLLREHNAAIAVLCKTTVARKVLYYGWKTELPIKRADIFKIDATKHFNASVDACLLVVQTAPSSKTYECCIFDDLNFRGASKRLGFRDGQIIADIDAYERTSHLIGESSYTWRSGVKHDC